MNVEKIKLDKNPNLFNNSLIHWTGRKNKNNHREAIYILRKIIDTSSFLFRQHKLLEPITEKHDAYICKSEYKASMVCFTDIPIEKSYIHCGKYGYVGIGFKKEVLIKYGASPVLYFTNEHKEVINTLKLNLPIIELNNDLNLSWLGSILQCYDTGKSEYFEREWRISRVLPMRNYNLNEKHKELFNAEREKLEGEVYSVLDSNNPQNDKYYIGFNKQHIDCLIAPGNFENDLKKLVEKYNLTCKIILLENP